MSLDHHSQSLEESVLTPTPVHRLRSLSFVASLAQSPSFRFFWSGGNYDLVRKILLGHAADILRRHRFHPFFELLAEVKAAAEQFVDAGLLSAFRESLIFPRMGIDDVFLRF